MLKMSLNDFSFDRSWSLFLDRDGVINQRIVGGYVTRIEEFRFLENVPEAVAMLGRVFGKLIVVTNQQGIGKGLMTEKDLKTVHSYMIEGIVRKNGRIDDVYFCPALEEERSEQRKPNTGMAMKAKEDHPGIDFKKSVMVGDSLTDMKFGKSLDMITVFITRDNIPQDANALIDFSFPTLFDFARNLYPLKDRA